MNRKTKIIIITISIIILSTILLLVVGNSFGFFKYLKKGEIVNVITIKGIEVKILNDEDDALNLENAYPIIDSEGMLSTPFEFTMTNNSSRGLDYSIKVENDTEKQETCKLEDGTTCPILSTDYIKYSYKKNDGTYSEPKILSSTNNVISSGSIATDEKITSSLILWIDSEAGNEIQNHYFFGKLIVTGEQQVSQVFKDVILANNPIISSTPTLTKTSQEANDKSGLYKSNATNSGNPTYYFRGNVENNYVDFAGFTWRIVRINEDGTVRLILSEGINNNTLYAFNPNYNSYTYMYYSNSGTNGAKYQLDTWYENNILNKGYSGMVATGDYYCEEAKTLADSSWTYGNANMAIHSEYKPNFECHTDGNNKGIVISNIGLLTYDEVVYAGGKYSQSNTDFYLKSTYNSWVISPSGYTGAIANVWAVYSNEYGLYNAIVCGSGIYRPVINLKADVWVTGNGTPSNPYEIDNTHKISVKETDSLVIGTPVTAIDGSKWHVLEESSSDSKYVTLLSDYNLNSDGTYNTTCGRDINSTYLCSTMAFDPDQVNTYDENDSTNIGYFIKNTYAPLVISKLPDATNITIPTVYQIANADNILYDNNSKDVFPIANLWSTTTSYWTKSDYPHNTNFKKYVNGSDSWIHNLVMHWPDYAGIRPVITTLKTNLIYN